jgi:crotonobetainyl-CoA:carnitine CoA-transferase CaiB-like acyl-CoA transferase
MLAGLRVVDASDGVAGGYCTRLFAGLGADVLKVEAPRTGDSLRRAGPFPGDMPHVETSGLHLHLNAAKRSITLDIGGRTGAACLASLLQHADVLVTGGRALHASLAPASISMAFPALVVTAISAYGSGGPHAQRRATDLVAHAAGGYLALNGDADRPPLKPYGEQSQYQAGLHAALGTMAALRARDAADAGGQHVDVSAVEAAGSLLAGALQRFVLMGRPQVRNGPRPASFAPNRLYPSTIRPCADGHVHVHCHNRFPDLISVLMEEPRLAAPEVLAEPLGHADEIDALMDAWLATRTRREAVAAAQELRVPMTEVFSPAEVLADADGHHASRRFFVDIAHPLAGTLRQPGAPIRAPAAPWRVARAPLLGEHNAEVYCGELGMSGRDLARLVAAGVI